MAGRVRAIADAFERYLRLEEPDRMSQILRAEEDVERSEGLFCAMITRAESILEERRGRCGDISQSCTSAAIATATALHRVKDGVLSREVHAELVAPIDDANALARAALDSANRRIMWYRVGRWGGHGVLFLVFLFVLIALVRWLKNTATVGYLNPEEFIAALVPTIIGISSPWIEGSTSRMLLALAEAKIASEMMLKMNTYIKRVLNNEIDE